MRALYLDVVAPNATLGILVIYSDNFLIVPILDH